MALPKRVLEACRRGDLVPPGGRLAVAVSGGMDSVVLLDVLAAIRRALGVELVVATLDHGLRGRSSAGDSVFVRRLAARYGLPCYCGRASALHGRGLEDAARQERMAFLRGVPAQRVALAHHRDDQAETVLLRLLRSASLPASRGMAPRRGRFVRPLLHIPREDLHSWAVERQLRWREDASNRDTDRERNLIRHELLPALDGVHGGARERLVALGAELRDHDLEPPRPPGTAGPTRVWLRGLRPGPRRSALFRHVVGCVGHPGPSRDRLEQAADLVLDGRAGAWVPLRAGWRLAVSEHDVHCLPPPPQPVTLLLPGPRRWGVHTVTLERPIGDRSPLFLRPPRAGERFGGQPLREWLRRRGVPAPLRPYHPVFCAGDRVVWVPGGEPVEALVGSRGLAITVTASIPGVCASGRCWTTTL